MRKTVRVEMEFEVDISEDSIQDILPDYREAIKGDADEDELFKQVAFGAGVNRWLFVEGIGNISDECITCVKKFEEYEVINEGE